MSKKLIDDMIQRIKMILLALLPEADRLLLTKTDIQERLKILREEESQHYHNWREAEKLIKQKKKEISKNKSLVSKFTKRATKKKDENEKNKLNEKARQSQLRVNTLNNEIENLRNYITSEKTNENKLNIELEKLDLELGACKQKEQMLWIDKNSKKALRPTNLKRKLKLLDSYEKEIVRKEKSLEETIDFDCELEISDEELNILDVDVLEEMAKQLHLNYIEFKKALAQLIATENHLKHSISVAEENAKKWERRTKAAKENNQLELVEQTESHVKSYRDTEQALTDQLNQNRVTTPKLRKAFESIETLKEKIDSTLEQRLQINSADSESDTEEPEI